VIAPLVDVPVTEITDADFTIAETEPRVVHYHALLKVCRLLHDGFAAARLPGARAGAFLVDLSRAFEHYLARGLDEELAQQTGWSVEVHPTFPVGPSVLQPDILVRHHGWPRIVLDAKWKNPHTAPDAADLHQMLAYATVTGAKSVGLVYPGRRFARREFSVPGTAIRASIFVIRVIGTTDECGRSIRRLTSLIRGGHA